MRPICRGGKKTSLTVVVADKKKKMMMTIGYILRKSKSREKKYCYCYSMIDELCKILYAAQTS